MDRFGFVAVILLLQFKCLYCVEDCDVHATITRRIENDGFHRDLHSLVEIVVDHADLWINCSVILEEKIPAALYVNPDQLQELQRFKQLSSCAAVMGAVNIELPEAIATEHTVIAYSPLQCTQNLLSAKLSLPVHARYRAPIPGGGHVEGHLNSPRLFLHCLEDTCLRANAQAAANFSCQPCVEFTGKNCSWFSLPYETNSVTMNIRIPVGNSDLRAIVVIVTLTITWTATVYVLSTIFLKHRKGKSIS
ncbi:phosphatidylinositol-glycan biosynthesis class X protein-like [Schistocerca nitens]|uniref:phosphatidylinositol-glycan biosynthesis class X protein-like n=1 Tax=Schistocerca nitens TaxID=7011 RepID=UPI002117D1DA|nr:phosphatidylinositol-glycan biosynthesis class X protein-like [Schistocerca nitens]